MVQLTQRAVGSHPFGVTAAQPSTFVKLSVLLYIEVLTYLIVVNFHGGVGQGAKDANDRDFPDSHFTH